MSVCALSFQGKVSFTESLLIKLQGHTCIIILQWALNDQMLWLSVSSPGLVLSSDSLEPLNKNNRLFVLTFQSNYLFSAISGGMWFIQLGKIMYNERLSCLHLCLSLIPHLECRINAVCVCVCVYGDRYHKSQAIYLESKDNTKISCVISSVGTNEVSFQHSSSSCHV